MTIAVIGSFSQHFKQVKEAIHAFIERGHSVLSPISYEILLPGIPFIRFATDRPDLSDSQVQSVALHRILQANLVYVVDPGGYVGRTTCYEIGRIVQAKRPIFFQEEPSDLPLEIPSGNVVAAQDLALLLSRREVAVRPLYVDDPNYQLESDLLKGYYRNL
jgi:hypothetical protein